MAGAATISVGFCCPECGAGLRALRADAGTVLGCPRCGEHVRVPKQPHPVESPADAPLIAGPAARKARLGAGLLLLSLVIFLVEFAVNTAVVGYWMATSGPAVYFTRETGELGGLLLAVWVADLTLFLGRNAARWVGYRLCEPAAGAVRADRWVRGARHAALIRGLAYPVVVVPWLLGLPQDETPIGLQALTWFGYCAWLVGVGWEFVVLFAWHRLLAELGGPDASGRVTRYALTTGLALVASSLAVAAVTVTLWAQQRGRQVPSSGQSIDPTAMTVGEWYAAGGLFAVISLMGAVLLTQYARMLLALRAGLAPAVR